MRNCVLYFQRRVKNLIVLANGENVSPEELETRLYQLEGVRDAIVYEKNQQITAEIYADPAVFPDEAALWRAVGEISRHLPPYKQIGSLIYRKSEFEKTAETAYAQRNRLFSKCYHLEKKRFGFRGRIRFTNCPSLVGLFLLTFSHGRLRGGVSRALKIEKILHFIQAGENRTPCIGFGG